MAHAELHPRRKPAQKKRFDDEGKVFYKEVPRAKLAKEYYNGVPVIDVHNHLRQDGLASESVWRNETWYSRMFASLLALSR